MVFGTIDADRRLIVFNCFCILWHKTTLYNKYLNVLRQRVYCQMCLMRIIIERRRSVKQWSFLVHRSCCMKTSCGLVWELQCPKKQRFTPVNLDTVNWDLTGDSRRWIRTTHTLWWYTMWHSTTHSITTSALKTAALEEHVTIISLLKVSVKPMGVKGFICYWCPFWHSTYALLDRQGAMSTLLSFLTSNLHSPTSSPCQSSTRS